MAPQHRPRRHCIIAGLLLSATAMSPSLWAAPACLDPHQARACFERLPEAELKAFYLRCARDSSQRRFSHDEAVQCWIAGDVLKARSFGGDFEALLAWWRRHRDDS